MGADGAALVHGQSVHVVPGRPIRVADTVGAGDAFLAGLIDRLLAGAPGDEALAFANALNRGAHIRVSILLNALPAGPKRLLEVWCFALAAAVAWYFTYYAYWFVYWSWKFKEVSQDQDATALWIPQSVMVVGGGLLAIALTDNLLHVIFKGNHRITRDTVDEGFEV